MMRTLLILTTALLCSAICDGIEEAQHLRRVQKKQPEKERPLKPKDKLSSMLKCIPMLKLIEYDPGQLNSGPDKEWLCELIP